MAERAVAITGLGVVTPGGLGAEALWQGLLAGKQFVRRVESFNATAFPCGLGGDLGAFSARDYVPKSYRKSVKVMARDIEIAVAAADMAFRDSGIITPGMEGGPPTIEPSRLGCNIGAGLICTDLDELGVALATAVDEHGKFSLEKWGRGGMNNLTPLWLLKYLPNMLSCHVTIIHQAKGPSNTITCGDASAHLAVGEATRMVARGAADAAIAGGAESKMNPMGLLRQALLKRLCVEWKGSPAEACRPFDVRHCGTVVGEGGGLVILEDAQRARARGAHAYAEVVGFASACNPAGIEVEKATAGSLNLAVSRALTDAGIAPGEVDLIVTHGGRAGGGPGRGRRVAKRPGRRGREDPRRRRHRRPGQPVRRGRRGRAGRGGPGPAAPGHSAHRQSSVRRRRLRAELPVRPAIGDDS
jgi:3-oxoacyl-[acyl-carrier-protein] synthase II